MSSLIESVKSRPIISTFLWTIFAATVTYGLLHLALFALVGSIIAESTLLAAIGFIVFGSAVLLGASAVVTGLSFIGLSIYTGISKLVELCSSNNASVSRAMSSSSSSSYSSASSSLNTSQMANQLGGAQPNGGAVPTYGANKQLTGHWQWFGLSGNDSSQCSNQAAQSMGNGYNK